MYINAWYLFVNSLAHLEVSESWVKTHTLIQTILETLYPCDHQIALGRPGVFRGMRTRRWLQPSGDVLGSLLNLQPDVLPWWKEFHKVPDSMLHPVSFIASLNIYNDSVLISMVLYGCLKRLSTYSIIAIHSFQHIFFCSICFCQMHLHAGAQPPFKEISKRDRSRLPRNWPHSGMQRYRALKSARLTMLWPTWGGEIDESHRPIFAPT